MPGDGRRTPGCELLVSGEILLQFLVTSGSVATWIAVPDSVAIVGGVFRHQVVPVELGASGEIVALTGTNALTLTVGVFQQPHRVGPCARGRRLLPVRQRAGGEVEHRFGSGRHRHLRRDRRPAAHVDHDERRPGGQEGVEFAARRATPRFRRCELVESSRGT